MRQCLITNYVTGSKRSNNASNNNANAKLTRFLPNYLDKVGLKKVIAPKSMEYVPSTDSFSSLTTPVIDNFVINAKLFLENK